MATRGATPPPPKAPPPDDPPEDEDEGESETDDDEAPESAPAARPAAARAASSEPPPGMTRRPPGRPRGRPRKGPPPERPEVGREAVAVMNTEARARPAAAHQVPRIPTLGAGSIDPSQESTKTLSARWPLVLEMLRQQGLPPEAVTIRVTVVAEGPYARPSAELGSIDGRDVVGGGQLDPADAIRLYIEEVYHSSMVGACLYHCDIMYKVAPAHRMSRGSKYICRGDLSLQPYQLILQQRRRAEDFARKMAPMQASPGLSPVELPLPHAPFSGPYPSLPPGVGAAAALPPGSPGAGVEGELLRGILQRVLSGEPVGPIAPAPPPPAPLESELERVVKIMGMVRQLQPAAPAMAPEVVALLGELKTELAARRATPGLGAAPPALPAAPPPDPMGQIKSAVGMLKTFREMSEEILGDGGKDDEDEEDKPFRVMDLPGGVKWPYGDDLPWTEQVRQFAMLNPNVSMQFLQGFTGILDKSVIGQAIAQFAQRAGVPAGAVPPPGVGAPPPAPGLAPAPTHLPPAMRPAPGMAAPPAPPRAAPPAAVAPAPRPAAAPPAVVPAPVAPAPIPRPWVPPAAYANGGAGAVSPGFRPAT